ncbi:MAG: hypothetical protein HXY51_16705 [Nitrospirae bacterium]|nr:hypothetical protein [Nitrospirota bacterium]
MIATLIELSGGVNWEDGGTDSNEPAQWTGQWPHFIAEVRDQFWGDLAQDTRPSWQDLCGA